MRGWASSARIFFRRILPFCLFLTLWAIPTPLLAQGRQRLGIVEATEFTPLPIAVPPLEPVGSERLNESLLSRVLAEDLRLSGFFDFPAEGSFVDEVQALDRSDDSVHYADWRRLGLFYVVKGTYRTEGGQLIVEIRTYDVIEGTVIFGRRYTHRKDRARELAHRASNDIIQRITTFPGVSHTRILFVGETAARRGAQIKEVYLIDADGQNLLRLTHDKSLAATPAWGANATEIYYTTYKDFNPDLAGVYLDGTHDWFVSRRPGFNLSPAWSQKKGRIVLTLTKDGNSELYLMDREGQSLRRLTYNRAIDSSPHWSPSSDQIAFTSDRSGSIQIHITDDSGVNIRRLTRQGVYNDGARWSPLGDRIAFTSRVDGVFQIFTIEPSGENLQQLTSGDYDSEDPTWAPNGYVIAYTANRGEKKQIHTIFADGRPITRLRTPFKSYSPDWSPMLP